MLQNLIMYPNGLESFGLLFLKQSAWYSDLSIRSVEYRIKTDFNLDVETSSDATRNEVFGRNDYNRSETATGQPS